MAAHRYDISKWHHKNRRLGSYLSLGYDIDGTVGSVSVEGERSFSRMALKSGLSTVRLWAFLCTSKLAWHEVLHAYMYRAFSAHQMTPRLKYI